MKKSGGEMNKYVICSNEQGFTMLDALYGFTIFILIMFLIPLSINHIIQSAPAGQTASNLQWTVFLQLLKKEVRMSEEFTASGENLILIKDNQKVNYEIYGTNIRRRVNEAGHEIVLQNVEKVTYEDEGNSIVLSLTDLNKQERSAVITPFILANAADN